MPQRLTILGAHAEFTTRATAADILEDLRQGGNVSATPPRIVFSIRLRECGFPDSILTLLTGRAAPKSADLERDLREVIGRTQSDRSMLLAAIVAFQRAHWIGARAFARHGLSLHPSPFVQAELLYLLAASIRYLLSSMTDAHALDEAIGEAREALATSIRLGQQAEDHCATRRARIEQQALELCLYRLRRYAAPSMSGKIPSPDVDLGAVLRDTIALRGWPSGNSPSSIEMALTAHAERLALGAAVLASIDENLGSHEQLRKEAYDALQQLRVGRVGHADEVPIHSARRLLADWLSGELTSSGTSLRLQEVLDRPGGESWMSPLDFREIESDLLMLRNTQEKMPSAA